MVIILIIIAITARPDACNSINVRDTIKLEGRGRAACGGINETKFRLRVTHSGGGRLSISLL